MSAPETTQLDQNWLRRFRQNVRSWYAKHARDLPWRRTGDPYRVWISEIMLQQTTVAAVVPYYERFIARFPYVEDLASASEAEVLRYWEGLGYYSRARNIHKTARKVVEDLGGSFPADVDELRALPGIGRYTAGAIASFAFGKRAPILEANTLRLYSRLLGYRDDPRSTRGQRVLWDFAGRILPRKDPGRFNQALMELGATVCTVTQPDCPACPVKSCCRAFAEGAQDEIPQAAKRPQTTDVTEAAVALHADGTYLLRQRGEGERWAGLWDFVRFPLDDEAVHVSENGRNSRGSRRRPAVPRKLKRVLEREVAEQTGLAAEVREPLTEIRHGVTRYRIRLLCFLAECTDGTSAESSTQHWVRPGGFKDYPLSVTGRELAELLAKRDRPSE